MAKVTVKEEKEASILREKSLSRESDINPI